MLNLFLAILITAMAVYFFMVYKNVEKTIAIEIVYSAAWRNKFEAERIEEKALNLIRENEKYQKLNEKQLKKKLTALEKSRNEYLSNHEKYMSGSRFTPADALAMFGYKLLAILKIDSNNSLYKKLVADCEHSGFLELEFSQEDIPGKKNASIYAYYLIGNLLSFIYVGVMVGIILIELVLLSGNSFSASAMVGLGAAMVFFILGYLPYDTIRSLASNRKAKIDAEFPDALSKITLLVIAGLNITKALEETVEGNKGLIYDELRVVIEESDRGATMEKSLLRMKMRCENEFLDKTVAVLSKSYTGGNTNLAESLAAINTDCWLEKKHNARRMAEVVQSKLYIPTMLMFLGILVVIIVPALSAFGGF